MIQTDPLGPSESFVVCLEVASLRFRDICKQSVANLFCAVFLSHSHENHKVRTRSSGNGMPFRRSQMRENRCFRRTTLLIKNWTFQGPPEFYFSDTLRSVIAKSIRRKGCAFCHGGVLRSGYPDKSAGQPPKQRPGHISSTGQGPENRKKETRRCQVLAGRLHLHVGGRGKGERAGGMSAPRAALKKKYKIAL